MEPVAATTIEREPDLTATDSVAMAAAEPDLLQDLPQDLPTTATVSTVEVADKAIVAANADDAEVLDAEVLDAAALDEALLDIVALEMAAPDPDGGEDYANADDDEVFEPAPAATTMAVEAPVALPPAVLAPIALAPVQAPRPEAALQPAPQPSFAAPSQPSIGSALLANGFLDQHRAPANDPLAPIRRMSQAEKIALFS
jgi:hypothetical protein